MTLEEQAQWLDEQQFRDPDWARNEYEVRRLAYEMRDRVLASTGPVTLAFHRTDPKTGSFRTVTLNRGDIWRIGGAEQLLLIEEIIRRELRG